jgi:uncharacterized Zn finger protein
MSRTWEARVDEYVDSRRMRERLKRGSTITCAMEGSYGTYRTRTNLRKRADSSCTCPSEISPCKHVEALRETYKLRPRSFCDVNAVMNKLAKKNREEVLATIEAMIVRAPAALGALGIKGFEGRVEDEFEDA